MELKIGKNIRRLRRDKGMTQEQLAELLNISCAAVSKWESCDTYPDITMIFPLAHLERNIPTITGSCTIICGISQEALRIMIRRCLPNIAMNL
jgi:transcriptional regulator with XRE-family HTH domain